MHVPFLNKIVIVNDETLHFEAKFISLAQLNKEDDDVNK